MFTFEFMTTERHRYILVAGPYESTAQSPVCRRGHASNCLNTIDVHQLEDLSPSPCPPLVIINYRRCIVAQARVHLRSFPDSPSESEADEEAETVGWRGCCRTSASASEHTSTGVLIYSHIIKQAQVRRQHGVFLLGPSICLVRFLHGACADSSNTDSPHCTLPVARNRGNEPRVSPPCRQCISPRSQRRTEKSSTLPSPSSSKIAKTATGHLRMSYLPILVRHCELMMLRTVLRKS